MNKSLFHKALPHLIAIVVFLVVAVIYCKPALDGKVLQQHDVVQWKAMAKNSFDYKEKYGSFPLWTNGMFSGMPTYQIAMEPDVPVQPGIFYYILTLGLPKPISFFFMACICFYFLALALRANPYIGIIGGLAFAYATYNPVIIAAGHETKMNTIAIMPAMIGSLILLYDRKYWLGGALTALFTCLLVGMNHLQIAYYTFLIVLFMTIGYVINWIRERQIKHMLLAGGIAVAAGLTGVLCNAVNIFTTSEYAKESIRGGSDLPSQTNTSTKDGLSKEYAFSYSMYKTEPFVMMVPYIYGGSNGLEIAEEDSKAISALQQMPQELAQQLQYNLGSYWGGIGITAGPPYAGAIICFLTLIGFFVLNNKHKWWILAVSVLAILMSWGEYFLGFNSFLLNNLPFYNKFRAPSMIMVIPTFLFCMMAVMTLQKIISFENKAELWEKYKKGLLLTAGVFVGLILFYLSSDFRSEGDKNLLSQTASAPDQVKQYIRLFLDAVEDDRKSLFFSSLLRSFMFIAVAAAMVWLSVKKNFSKLVVLGVIGSLAFIDVMAIDTKYLSSKNYQEDMEYQQAFTPSAADAQILQDTSYYRVLDVRQGLNVALGMQGALPSYFHKSVGGYHPAKLSIYQDLIEHQLSKFPQSLPVYNMLNTKYVIQRDQQGKDQVIQNPEALGAAWFVKAVRFEETPAAVMNALNNFNPADTAVVFTKDKSLVTSVSQTDSAASIRLVRNINDEVVYQSNSSANGFAVFSEVFYDKGWKAYVDGKETPIVRTNYVLRGLSLPAGQHEIRFVFHPSSYYTGQTISTVASILVFLALFAAAFQVYRSRKNTAKA
ncbi:MAG TPA: YfhO family protein [Flavisolibacter sp.]|nr:YfhO family protein [Flavisolibacter sp.]